MTFGEYLLKVGITVGVVIVMFGLFLLLAGAWPGEHRHQTIPRYVLENMLTVEYDGHLWVMTSTSEKAGLAHHPDCPKCEGRGK